MSTKKISELQSLEMLSNNDLVPVVDTANEATKKITAKQLGAATGIPTNAVIGYDGNTIPSGYEEVDGPNDYSTSEKVIGKWIDGKPLYRKVINFGSLPDTSDKDVAHNISNIGDLVNITGMTWNSNKFFHPLPFSANSTNQIRLEASLSNVKITTYSSWTAYTTTYVILEYTKTTD